MMVEILPPEYLYYDDIARLLPHAVDLYEKLEPILLQAPFAKRIGEALQASFQRVLFESGFLTGKTNGILNANSDLRPEEVSLLEILVEHKEQGHATRAVIGYVKTSDYVAWQQWRLDGIMGEFDDETFPTYNEYEVVRASATEAEVLANRSYNPEDQPQLTIKLKRPWGRQFSVSYQVKSREDQPLIAPYRFRTGVEFAQRLNQEQIKTLATPPSRLDFC